MPALSRKGDEPALFEQLCYRSSVGLASDVTRHGDRHHRRSGLRPRAHRNRCFAARRRRPNGGPLRKSWRWSASSARRTGEELESFALRRTAETSFQRADALRYSSGRARRALPARARRQADSAVAAGRIQASRIGAHPWLRTVSRPPDARHCQLEAAPPAKYLVS